MESGILSDVLLPLAIVLIMIAMGMTLTMADFRRVLADPKPVGIGLFCQLLILPALGFAVAGAFGLAPAFAVSMVLLASSPGGSTSNLIVHVADGDRALSISLTSISNLVVFVALPVYLGLAQEQFGSVTGGAKVPVVDLVVQIAALTIIPIAMGMGVRAKYPNFAIRAEQPGKIFSSLVLAVIILGLVIQNWGTIVEEAPEFGPAFVTLNALALAAGFGVATLLKVNRRQAVTIAIETGIQNSTIAIAIALSIFDSEELAIVPGLYGLWMLFTGFGFAFLLKDRSDPALADRATANVA